MTLRARYTCRVSPEGAQAGGAVPVTVYAKTMNEALDKAFHLAATDATDVVTITDVEEVQ